MPMPSRLRVVRVAVLAVLVCGLGTVLAWYAMVHPWAEAAIGQRLGRQVRLGWLGMGRQGLVARDVTLFGRAPFANAPVAFVDRVEIHLGGPGGVLSPGRIVVDGVELNLLITPQADNWRGASKTVEPRKSAPATSTPAPVPVEVHHVRLQGTFRLPNGTHVAFRAPRVDVTRDQPGPLAVQIEHLTVEWPGFVTARIPNFNVQINHGTEDGQQVSLFGRDITVGVPGAEPILPGLALDGSWRRQGWDLSLSTGAPEDLRAPFVAASARMGSTGLQMDVDAQRVPLAGLAPLLQEAGAGLSHAHANLKMSVGWDGRDVTIPWQLTTQVTDLSWRHPALATTAWPGLHMGADLKGDLTLAGDPRLIVKRGQIQMLGIPLLVSGTTTLSARPNGKLTVSSPSGGIPCARLLDGQPRSIRQALSGMKMAGALQFSVALGFDASRWDDIALDLKMPALCRVLEEPAVIARNQELLVNGGPGQLSDRPNLPVGSDYPDFTPLGRMPPHLLGAFLTAEDNAFFQHHGFQIEMIRRALAYNLERGEFVRGASTITQQLTKNLFLTHDRTIARKLAETVLSWRINELVPKRRVLELYMNVLELGPEIHGVARAAQIYFGKPLGELRPIESAHLASLPPNPRGFARRFRDGRVDDGWLHRLYDLLGMMRRRGHISNAEATAAFSGRLHLRKI